MASRKDNKGRVLQTGEYQRKDGRYSFSYSDAVGTRHVFYATTLQELRVKEKDRFMAGWQGANMYGMQVTRLVDRMTCRPHEYWACGSREYDLITRLQQKFTY